MESKKDMISKSILYVDDKLTKEAQENEKYAKFKQWLLQNGAVFDKVEFPAIFDTGLMGIAAKSDIDQYKAFLFIPNSCIISVTRVKQSDEVGHIVRENAYLFDTHPDADQLTLTIFLMHEYLKGEKSFWWPYIQVMNESDLACFWSEDEINLLNDFELRKEAQTYRDEVLSEWEEISKIIELYPEDLKGANKELFLRMYNYACTRCFGWTLPSTMMVPLADFLNHQPSDTQYEIYQKQLHTVKASVDSLGYKTVKRFSIDYTDLYTPRHLKDFDEDIMKKITGAVELIDKIHIPRNRLFKECKEKLQSKQETVIWELGYWSTDVDEDNDTSVEDEEEYYDEEEDNEEEIIDPTTKIEQEKFEKSLAPEEKKFMGGISDIEKKILQQNENLSKKKKNKYSDEDFKWWNYNDKDTYFALTTKRKNTYKAGEQLFNCYGRRSNKFLLVFYGFCLLNNQYDSLQIRIWRSLEKENKTESRLVRSLIVTEEQFLEHYDDIDQLTKIIRFKTVSLNEDLMAYLRAHCLLMYKGTDFQKLKMTEPTILDYEITVLEQYQYLLLVLKDKIFNGISFDEELDYLNNHCETWRKKFIWQYRVNHMKILNEQLSLVNTLLMILREVQDKGVEGHKKIIQNIACLSDEEMKNCLQTRKYLKQLFSN